MTNDRDAQNMEVTFPYNEEDMLSLTNKQGSFNRN